jgi:hypothetical protein
MAEWCSSSASDLDAASASASAIIAPVAEDSFGARHQTFSRFNSAITLLIKSLASVIDFEMI